MTKYVITIVYTGLCYSNKSKRGPKDFIYGTERLTASEDRPIVTQGMARTIIWVPKNMFSCFEHLPVNSIVIKNVVIAIVKNLNDMINI